MAVDRLLPGEASIQPNTGMRWSLPDAEFKRWWAALLAEDRSEFLDLYGGSMMEARMVCALDYLTNVEGRSQTSDLILRAYVLAANNGPDGTLSEEQGRLNAVVREKARMLWEQPAVTALLDRIRHRASRQAAARIEQRMTAEIETMFTELDDSQHLDPELKVKLREAVLKASLQYTKNVAADRRVDHEIRATAAYKRMLEDGRQRKVEPERLPTPQEFSALLTMAKESFDEQTFESIIRPMLPAPVEESEASNE